MGTCQFCFHIIGKGSHTVPVTPRGAGKYDITLFPEIKENQNTRGKHLMATSNGHWLLEISVIIFRELLFGLFFCVFFFLILIFSCFVMDPIPFYLQPLSRSCCLPTLIISCFRCPHCMFCVLCQLVLPAAVFSSPVVDSCILGAHVRYLPPPSRDACTLCGRSVPQG